MHWRAAYSCTTASDCNTNGARHNFLPRCCSEFQAIYEGRGECLFQYTPDQISEVSTDAFSSSVKRLFHISVSSHPFIRVVIPKLFGHAVFEYVKGKHDIRFTLDDGTARSSKPEYRLDYYTGDIKAAGVGVVHELYKWKAFFVDNGNTMLMAEMLASIGLGKKMMFDAVDKVWRIFDTNHGIWRHRLSEYEPQSIVGLVVEEQLDPLIHLESFRGEPLPWDRFAATRADAVNCVEGGDSSDEDDGTEDDDELDGYKCVRSDTAGKKRACAKSASEDGDSRKRTRNAGGSEGDPDSQKVCARAGKAVSSRISAAKYRFGQTLKDQTEVLKMLEHHLILDFAKEQPKHLLCCPNGVVDLRTGQLLGPPTPDQYFTHFCATKFNPEADMQHAIDFFRQAFPVEAYPDSTELVRFVQQYGGYSLTLETNLQYCVFVYGRGANAKSLWMKMFADVWGGLRCTMPIECLGKARGTNNDSLSNAMRSRLVTLSESNGSSRIDAGTFNALVCGEETTCKKMYKEETNLEPVMKLMFFLNDLPQFPPGAYHSARRCAFLPLRKIYYDHDRDEDQRLMADHRARGEPECLIGKRDVSYYDNHVKGKEEAFLRFFVEGAVGYYGAGKSIRMPPTMQFQAKCEAFDLPSAVEEFVSERLAYEPGGKVLVADMHTEFLRVHRDDTDSFSCTVAKFGKDAREAIRKRTGVWEHVNSRNTRVNGRAGTAYVNVRMVDVSSGGTQCV